MTAEFNKIQRVQDQESRCGILSAFQGIFSISELVSWDFLVEVFGASKISRVDLLFGTENIQLREGLLGTGHQWRQQAVFPSEDNLLPSTCIHPCTSTDPLLPTFNQSGNTICDCL